MTPAKEILIVDDEVGIRELLSEILQDEGYRVSLAENATAARAYRAREQPALVLLDIWMPDTDGVTLLREWAASGQLTMPVVMMSGHGTIETAVEATKIGAFDFLEKPVGPAEAPRHGGARAQDRAGAGAAARFARDASARAPPMRDVERQMEQLLAARKPLLILGEPGAGHDVAARALHAPDTPRVVAAERRAARGESARGARGGARRHALLRGDRPIREGRAARARVPAAEARQGERHARLHEHGAARQHGRGEQVRRGAARGAVGRRRAASAAARAARGHPGADRALLARRRRAGAQRAAARGARCSRRCSRRRSTCSTGAYWPGNLDHLQSVVANLALYAGSGDITTEHVKRLLGEAAAANQAVAPEITARFFELPLREAREAFERIYFEQLLGREQSNMSRVAERAGLERTHLYRKLKQLSIRFARRGDDGNGGNGGVDAGSVSRIPRPSGP